MDEKWKLSKNGEKYASISRSRRTSLATAAAEEAGGGRSMSMRGGERRSAATGRSFSRRWASLVKEQRARFYIMRRCVAMLICWRDYS